MHVSKQLWDKLELYTAISYESIKISTDYKYYLPLEVKFQLGLRETQVIDGKTVVMPPDSAHPGDTEPQFTTLKIDDTHLKWVIGARYNAGPFALYADYSVSNFNIFSAGLEININKLYHVFKGDGFNNKGNYDLSDIKR